MNTTLNALRACTDEAGLLTEPSAMASYLSDWTGREQGLALAVARPSSTEQVAAIVRTAAAHDLVITPQGGNTGLTGAGVPRDGPRSLLLSLDQMTRIRALDLETPSVTAEAGCILATVQDTAREANLCLPLGLGAEGSCTLGGVVSTNAGGIRALRYGNCRENVMGVEAVLADGSIWNGLRALRKHNMGYDLKQLFVGAEGTLGIVTAALVRLTPAWTQVESAWVAVRDPASAMALLARLRRAIGDVVVACELIEGFGLSLALEAIPTATSPLSDDHPWLVLVEVATAAELGSLREQFSVVLSEALEAGDVVDAVLATNETQRASFWRLREGVVEGQKRAGASIKHDVSVPLGAVPGFIAQATAAAHRAMQGVRPLSFGHVGDGNIHFTIIQPVGCDRAEFMKLSAPLMAQTHDIALALGGSISAEHGVGVHKRDEFERVCADVEMKLLRSVKSALAPFNRMNPGVLLRALSV